MKLVNIGDFTVDVEQHRIFKQQSELAVEPKVIAVLCYLLHQRERFVSLQELHDNVWAGRVVTDTAVRRTISKLRALLQDTDTDNPKFIRSQMKRGYQLICNVNLLAEPTILAAGRDAILVNTVPPNSQFNPLTDVIVPLSPPEQSVSKSRYSRRVALLLPLCLLVLGALYWQFMATTVQPPAIFEMAEQKQLLSLPGEKTSLTVSKDGRFQAFVAKVNSTSNWELYLYDAEMGRLQKIATPAEHTRFVSFIASDSKLAYVGYDGNKASLFTQVLDELTIEPVLHPTEPFSLLGNLIELTDNKLLMAAAKTPADNFHYYQYDLSTDTFEQFTFSSETSIQDAFGTLSPNKQFLALERANIYQQKVVLQIYRVADKELFAEYPLQDNLQDVRTNWLNDKLILMRLGNKHELINIQTGERTAVLAEPHPLHEFSFTANGELIGLNVQQLAPVIYQTSWPLEGNFNKSYQLGNSARQLSFSNNEDFLWLVVRDSNGFSLYQYEKKYGTRKLVLESAEPLTLLDQTQDSTLLLLKRGKRLETFNTLTAEVTAVSVSTQEVETGNFSRTGEFVYYSERIKDQWLIKRYQLADKTETLPLEDYRYLQEYADGYIAADNSGSIWQLDSRFNKIHLLYEGVLLEVHYQILVRNDQLIVAYRTLMGNWTLVEVNLISQQQWQRTLPQYDFGLPFFIDQTGQQILYKTYPSFENQLVKYSYSFD